MYDIMMRYHDGMMVRMQIQFTEEQVSRLRLEARERGVSISSIVRERFDATPPAMPSRREALAGLRSFDSEVSDLSTNHDLYVADAYDPK